MLNSAKNVPLNQLTDVMASLERVIWSSNNQNMQKKKIIAKPAINHPNLN